MTGWEIALLVLGIIVALCLIVYLALYLFVNDAFVGGYKRKVKFQKGDKVMYVFAHPDDEVLLSGTLALLKKRYDVKIKAVYLTHGEDGPTGNLVEKKDLLAERTKELGNVKQTLGIDEMTIKFHPDRYLSNEDHEVLLQEVIAEGKAFSPKYIFTTDDVIGLYGHPDHVQAGKTAKAAARELESVEGLFVMTLPKQMIKLAMKMSKTFRERFDRTHSLPVPNVQFDIAAFGKTRLAVTKCHKTQWQVMNELQPFYDKLPWQIYYAIFCKEYFEYLSKK